MKKPSEDASLGAFSVSGEFFIHDHMGADAGYVKGAAGALPAELFVIQAPPPFRPVSVLHKRLTCFALFASDIPHAPPCRAVRRVFCCDKKPPVTSGGFLIINANIHRPVFHPFA